jgi:hypothetical protein
MRNVEFKFMEINQADWHRDLPHTDPVMRAKRGDVDDMSEMHKQIKELATCSCSSSRFKPICVKYPKCRLVNGQWT